MSYSGTVCDCDPNTTECCDICQGVDGTEKDIVENPKDVIGSDKLPVHLFSAAGVAMGALGKLDGALKYGRNNFRAANIRYTIYLDALKRHIDALQEGEDDDPESNLHHLCHILASADILADAYAGGTLIDDRNFGGAYWRGFLNKITPHVKRLKEKHKDKNPKHWTIKDNGS